jgi:hypothetical protein
MLSKAGLEFVLYESPWDGGRFPWSSVHAAAFLGGSFLESEIGRGRRVNTGLYGGHLPVYSQMRGTRKFIKVALSALLSLSSFLLRPTTHTREYTAPCGEDAWMMESQI